MTTDANDPTQSGTILRDAGDVHLSRNEIEALCTKAARGGGMEWGLAEEAGAAAGWLSHRGVDAPAALLAQLRSAAGRDWTHICPRVAPGAWHPHGQSPMCPIAVGAALGDFAGTPAGLTPGGTLDTGPVSHPVLLLPFLAGIARRTGRDISLRWDGGQIGHGADGTLTGDVAALEAVVCAPLHLAHDGVAGTPVAATGVVASRPETLAALNALAMKTTVPASDKSRADAGSASGDND